MSDLDSPILRPGAFARTPFGTPFFKLFTHPEIDGSGLFKRRLGARMREEIVAWEKLQRTGKLSKNRSYAAVLQEDGFAGEEAPVDAPTAERIDGAGFVVGGAGYPDYFVPDVDGPGGETGVGEATAAPTDHDDRLWPDTYSIGSDSDIDNEVDGFVVIDMADATGSVFWKHTRQRRRKVERAEESPSLWSRLLDWLRPAGAMDW